MHKFCFFLIMFFTSNCFSSDGFIQLKNISGHLRLNLDINGVVLGQETVEDSVSPPEVYANVMLAYGTFYKWDGNFEESYKDYVWTKLYPGNKVPREVKKDVVQNFKTCLIEQGHPLAAQINDQYNRLVSVLKTSIVFQSLDVLVKNLKEREVKYSLIFRTFGKDGGVIQRYFEKKFPDFKFRIGAFNENGTFTYNDVNENEVLISSEDAFDQLMNEGHHWLIQDNFYRWKKNNETSQFGKLFTFSSGPENKTISLFFDDNLNIVSSREERSIVSCYDTFTKKFVSTKQASCFLHRVNPINSALDPNYLKEIVNQKIQKILSLQR